MTTIKDFRTVERSRVEYALLGLIVVVFVFGAAKLLGQTGLVAAWGALLTYLAEPAGSVRQRLGNMGTFAVFGFVQILLVALVGDNTGLLLLLLFTVSFVCSWMMGFGGRAALVGFVSNIWITLMPTLGVAADLVPSLLGYTAGSLLVIVASIGYGTSRLGLVTAMTVIIAAQFIAGAVIVLLIVVLKKKKKAKGKKKK